MLLDLAGGPNKHSPIFLYELPPFIHFLFIVQSDMRRFILLLCLNEYTTRKQDRKHEKQDNNNRTDWISSDEYCCLCIQKEIYRT